MRSVNASALCECSINLYYTVQIKNVFWTALCFHRRNKKNLMAFPKNTTNWNYEQQLLNFWILWWISFINWQISEVAVFVSIILEVVWVLGEPDIQHAKGTNGTPAEKLPPVTGTRSFHLSLWTDLLLDEQMISIPQANATE